MATKANDGKKAPTKATKAQEAKKPAVKKTTTKTTANTAKKTPAAKKTVNPSTPTPGTIAPYVMKKGEEYMNERQKEHFVAILNSWKRDLMEGVDQTVIHMKQEAANFPDHNDRASQEEEFSLELRTRDRERKLLKKIENTLERIHDDDFGYCDVCGIEIGIRRLEARPIATMCIDCKEIAETKEKQESG